MRLDTPRAPLCALTLAAATLTAGAAHADRNVAYGELISLRSHHGTHAVAESDGRLRADRPHVGDYERFTVQTADGREPLRALHFGDTVALRSFHGTYVVAESDGRANADRGGIGDWERVTLLNPWTPDDRRPLACGSIVGLRSHHGTWFVAESNGEMNANRAQPGEWERFRIDCQSAPRIGELRFELKDAGGLALVLTHDQITYTGGNSARLQGNISLEAGGVRTELVDADVEISFGENGVVETFVGRARVLPDAPALLAGAEYTGSVHGEIGLRYGGQLAHLGAPLRGDTRYLYVELEAGAGIDFGPSSMSVSAGTTWILDGNDPFIYAEGRIQGLSELTFVERAGIGVSAHGRIPLAAAHTWGLDGVDTDLDGHLYLDTRVALPKVPVTVDGELLLRAELDHAGRDLLRGGSAGGFLLNGSAEVSVGFGPFTAFSLPLGAGSVGGAWRHDGGEAWFSGESGPRLSDLIPGLPFEAGAIRRAAGFVSSDIARSFVQLGADVQLAGFTLGEALLRIGADGARLTGDVDLERVSIQVTGDVGPHGFSLRGQGRVDAPIRAPREVVEWVDVAVEYTANFTMCGYESVTSGALCGTRTVTDGAICGVDTIRDAFECALNGFQNCTRDRTCTVDNTCDVPASCTRIEQRENRFTVPEFDYGSFRADLDLHVDPNGLAAGAAAEFCAPDGGCQGLGGGDVRVDQGGVRLCGDVPGLGHHCVSL